MQHRAVLTTPEQNLIDVHVAIQDRAGVVVVARTPAALVVGTTDTYAALLNVPDTVGSGREIWDSVVAGFAGYPSAVTAFAPQPVALTSAERDSVRAGLSTHSPLDVWNVSQNAFFIPNTLGAKLKLFLLDTFGRVKLSREENVLSAGEAAGIGGFNSSDRTALIEVRAAFDAVQRQALVIDAPPTPEQTTAYALTLDASGNPVGGIEVRFRLVSVSGTGSVYGHEITAVSAATGQVGLLQKPLARNAQYEASTGDGFWVPFQTGSQGQTPLPSFILKRRGR